MEIITISTNIIQIKSENIIIHSLQDTLDIITMAKYEYQANAIVINKENIIEEFFDLRTGLAGEILQKFINYQMKIVIIGDLNKYTNKALQDFIRESNKGNSILFLPTKKNALERLTNIM